jgi:hypothetical protein
LLACEGIGIDERCVVSRSTFVIFGDLPIIDVYTVEPVLGF